MIKITWDNKPTIEKLMELIADKIKAGNLTVEQVEKQLKQKCAG